MRDIYKLSSVRRGGAIASHPAPKPDGRLSHMGAVLPANALQELAHGFEEFGVIAAFGAGEEIGTIQ